MACAVEAVVVAVPVYKAGLDGDEAVSLAQVKKVLGKHPIVFFAPESLAFDYGEDYAEFPVERFPNEFFTGTDAYSRLMLSSEFYERFAAYDYILIYQLDAFVFSDRLQYFCSLGYDYIGAPLPRWMPFWRELAVRVGNGGFSLRKTRPALRMLERKAEICASHPLGAKTGEYEDLFWAMCAARPELGFKVPNIKTALSFSMESDVGNAYKRLGEGLPFGCHAWNKVNRSLWKPFIESLGYVIEEKPDVVNTREFRWRRAEAYLWERMLRAENWENGRRVAKAVIEASRSFALWGAGQIGGKCLEGLSLADVKISKIYDKAAVGQDWNGFTLSEPSREAVTAARDVVVVATRKFETEISATLEEWGLEKGRDYFTFDDLYEELVRTYGRTLKRFDGRVLGGEKA